MSHLSIFEPAWINLVFEGKNKEYGAYQLRRENSKTTIKALFIALILVAATISIPLFGSNTIAAVIIPNHVTPTVVIHDVVYPPKIDPPKKTTVVPITKSEATKSKPSMANPVVVEKEKPTVDIPKNIDIPAVTSLTGTGKSNPNGATPINGDGGTSAGIEKSPTEGIPSGTSIYKSVDKLPQYPGGIEKFYQYVSRNFRSPEDEQISSTSVRVVVTFVIEKDGSMTDIKVLQNPGYGMDKEAIRVLKSLKIKWEPGQIKGIPVRTAYSLPISVKAP